MQAKWHRPMYVHLLPGAIGWGCALVLIGVWVLTGNRTAVPFVGAFLAVVIGTAWSVWRFSRFQRVVENADYRVCPRCAQLLTGYDEIERCPECGTALDADDLKEYWTEMFRFSD